MTGPLCLACGDTCRIVRWSGAVGPFCSERCQNKNDDARLWGRASAYAERVRATRLRSTLLSGRMPTARCCALDESDVARAFVIGYAAGVEETSLRRRVKR